MAAPVIRVQGLREMRSAFRKVDTSLNAGLREANVNGARRVVDAALPNVPVRSGRLKASVRALGSQASGRAVAGSARVPYGAAVHWGRKGPNAMPGRPFLWDAARRVKGEVAEEYERAVMGLFNRMMP